MTKILAEPVPVDEPPPPKTKGAQGAYVAPLVTIRDNPGQWYKIVECDRPAQANGIASNLRNGHTARPDGDYDFAADGRDVFARYNGAVNEPYEIVRKGKVISS